MPNSLQELQQLYQRYRRIVFFILLLLIASLIMIFVNRSFSLPILLAAVIFHLAVLRPCQKKYTTTVTHLNLRQTLCRTLGNDEIAELNGDLITADTLTSAGLMPCGDESSTPLLRWGLHGERKGLRVSLCDATIPQNFRLAAKGKRRVHFNAGVWVHIDLPSDTHLHYRLLDETSVPTPIRMDFFSGKWNYETAHIPDSDLGKRFVLYRPKNTEQEPSHSLIQKLKALMEYTPGYVALSVNSTRLDVFVRGRFLARAVSVSQKPSQALIDLDPFPELDYILELAKTLLH